jgi:hypothetical protein
MSVSNKTNESHGASSENLDDGGDGPRTRVDFDPQSAADALGDDSGTYRRLLLKDLRKAGSDCEWTMAVAALEELDASLALSRNRTKATYLPLLGYDATPEDFVAIEALSHVHDPSRVFGASHQLNGRPCGCGCSREVTPGMERGWHQSKGPLPLLARRRGLSRGEYPSWADHPYRVRTTEGFLAKGWQYVAEPYGLSSYSLADLAWLAGEHGYKVEISAALARHFPSWTVAVILTPPGGQR